MQKSDIKYSIVVGAYKEEKRIPKTLDALSNYLKNRGIINTTEVIIVVADSNDDTKGIVEKYRDVFPLLSIVYPGKQVGKGRDIKLGMLSAKGDLKIFMDADMATPLHHLDTVFEKWQKERFDVLIGVRDLKTIHKDFFRRSISRIGNLVFFIVGGFYIQDTQCGFKAFSKETAEVCFQKLTRMSWSFDMELLIIAKLNGYKINQLQINDWQDIPGGTFSGSIGHSIQFFRDLLKIFLNRVLGVYK